MISKYFIDRPIFAWVLSLGIVLAGLISLRALPLEQYPEIAPPTIEISAVYPGASAKAVEEAVTTLIEREKNGAPGLALAALYESWTIPIAVLLVVPLGILGAVSGVTVRGLPNDIYFRVGLIATIGLSAKNAILIVEVAKDLHEDGKELYAATIEAAKLRLRPIIMTSLAFGVGVVPLVVSSGAGSGAQTAIGTGVLGGIIFATVLAIFLVPMFFVTVMRYLEVYLKSGEHIESDDASEGREVQR